MKKVVIYGYTGAAKDVIYSLDTEEYEIVGIIDDALEAHGYIPWIEGIEVKSLESINKLDYDYAIISSPWHCESMMAHLNSVGVNKEKVIVWKPIEKVKRLDQRIAYLRLCIDQIKEKNIDGACAEVGVYKGEFSKYINRFLPDRKLYLFDTFRGFGNQNILDVEKQKSNKALGDFRDVTVKEVLGKMSTPENCVICEGYFPQTAEEIDDKFVLVSLDADLYEPILNGLKYFYPRLVKGGYIFVHDYGGYKWPGVKMAVDEYCRVVGVGDITIFPILDRCLSVIITK